MEAIEILFLVGQMTGARWKLNHLERIERAMFAALESPGDPATAEALMAQAFLEKDRGNGFSRLDRYRASLERTAIAVPASCGPHQRTERSCTGADTQSSDSDSGSSRRQPKQAERANAQMRRAGNNLQTRGASYENLSAD